MKNSLTEENSRKHSFRHYIALTEDTSCFGFKIYKTMLEVGIFFPYWVIKECQKILYSL